MEDNRKKRIIIVSVVIVVVIVGVALFFLLRGKEGDEEGENPLVSFFGNIFGTNNEPSSSTTTPGTNGNNKPPVQPPGEKRIFQITNEPTAGATLSSDGKKLLYFKTAKGNLFENVFEGEHENRISNITIPSVLEAMWTPSKNYAALGFFTEGTLHRAYVHVSSTSSVTSGFLPENISAIAPSHTEDKIAYAVIAGDGASIFTALPDNTKLQRIYTTELTDITLEWPKATTLSITSKGSAYAPGHVFTLDTKTNTLTPLLSTKEGLDVLWSPTGEHILYSQTEKQGRVLGLFNLTHKDNALVTFPFATLPEKCTWSNTSKERVLYCGVPQTTPSTAHLPDEWWQGTVSFNDEIWKINLDTKERQLIWPVSMLDAVHMFLSVNDEYLFFINKKDGFLWSIKLTEQES